jgi:hypothetical protein
MRKRMSVVLAVVISSFAIAQTKSPRSAAADNAAASETCAFTFSSGSGHGVTQYCVTANGNIAQFSVVAGNTLPSEFLKGVAPAIEGYGLCDTSTRPFTAYWDYASGDSGNWNAATSISTPTSVKITRTTADGVWKIVQTIAETKGSKFTYGSATIAMALTNLSTSDRIIILNRYANIDAGESIFNDFDRSEISVWGGVPDGNGPALSLTAAFVNTPFDFSISFVNTVPDAPIPCQSHTTFTSGFFEGDGGVDQDFNLEIAPGKTKTVVVAYRPM